MVRYVCDVKPYCGVCDVCGDKVSFFFFVVFVFICGWMVGWVILSDTVSVFEVVSHEQLPRPKAQRGHSTIDREVDRGLFFLMKYIHIHIDKKEN